MSARIWLLIIAMLVLSFFGILAFGLTNKYKQQIKPNIRTSSPSPQPKIAKPPLAPTASDSAARKQTLEKLTGEDLDLFKYATTLASPSASQVKPRFDLIRKKTQKTDTLIIDECLMTPIVAEVTQNSSLTIKNTNDSSHQIQFDTNHKYVIAGKDQIQIKVDLRSPGIYQYHCDFMPSGFLVVSPK